MAATHQTPQPEMMQQHPNWNIWKNTDASYSASHAMDDEIITTTTEMDMHMAILDVERLIICMTTVARLKETE